MTLVYSLSGCSGGSEQATLNKANQVFNKGVPKSLTIHLSPLERGALFGPEVRFYDTDGDGRTVEQYLELYDTDAGIPNPSGVKVNLLRPGAEPVYGSQRSNTLKVMTPEQMRTLDSLYQSLLNAQEESFLNK